MGSAGFACVNDRDFPALPCLLPLAQMDASNLPVTEICPLQLSMHHIFRFRIRPFHIVGVFTALAAIGLSGCASATRIAFPPEKRAQINSSHPIVGVRQQEIGTSINKSNVSAAMGGGLIGAIVDSSVENSRAKKAEAAVIPIRDSLVGYEIGKVFSDALSAELPALGWLKAKDTEFRALSESSLITTWVNEETSDVALVIQLDYRLAPEFFGTTVAARVSAYPRTPALRAGAVNTPPVVYFNTLSALFPLTGADANLNREAAAALWSANKGEKIRASLDTGLRELARMLVFDLEQTAPANQGLYKAPAGTETRTVPPHTAFDVLVPFAMRGYVVHEETGRVWVRMLNGDLVSVSK